MNHKKIVEDFQKNNQDMNITMKMRSIIKKVVKIKKDKNQLFKEV